MIKTGFLVYFCSSADSLKDRCFGFFFLSPLIRELELVFKRGAPFPGRGSIWHLMESWLCLSRRLPSLVREENHFWFRVCSFMGCWHTESLIFARYWVPSARYWVPSYPLQPKRSWLLLASRKSGPRRPQVVFTNYLCAFACQTLSELISLAYKRFQALMTLACH